MTAIQNRNKYKARAGIFDVFSIKAMSAREETNVRVM